MNKFCQSCGFPLKNDKKGGGSEADGSISTQYCSMCYENGEFLNPPEIKTAKQFQAYCIEQMKADGMNGLWAWILTRGIPRLDRWKHAAS